MIRRAGISSSSSPCTSARISALRMAGTATSSSSNNALDDDISNNDIEATTTTTMKAGHNDDGDIEESAPLLRHSDSSTSEGVTTTHATIWWKSRLAYMWYWFRTMCCWCCCRNGNWSCARIRWCLLCNMLLLSMIIGIGCPILYHTIEERYPNVPLQWHIDVPSAITPTDTFQDGKSCRYSTGQQRWICISCQGSTTTTNHNKPQMTSTSKCRTLQPRGFCPGFPRYEWDKNSYSQSVYDPNSNVDLPYRTISHADRFYSPQPQCTMTNPICFDLHRCVPTTTNHVHNNVSSTTGPITVYVNSTTESKQKRHNMFMEIAIERGIIRRVDDYREACLIIVFTDSYNTKAELQSAMHWKSDLYHEGRNHLIYNMARIRFNHAKRLSNDAPLTLFHVGHAAIASDAWTSSMFRTGYDQALPLRRKWGRPMYNNNTHVGGSTGGILKFAFSHDTTAANFEFQNAPTTSTPNVDIHRPRKWLLSFRGTVKDEPYPYYQHRWLAAEYWDGIGDDVFVDVQCTHSMWFASGTKMIKNYEISSPTIYDEVMWESTFGFAPGGSGVGSYRFAEILSTGGIPVVTHDLVLPLSPEIEWNDCVIRVSEARIIDLPRILRDKNDTEIRNRQQRCWQLLQIVIGDKEEMKTVDGQAQRVWKSNAAITFAKSMEIWSIRIQNARALQNHLKSINYE